MSFPKAVLVDLDGTLVDTRETNFRAYAAVLKNVGVTLNRHEWDTTCAGLNWRQFLPKLVAHRPDVDPARLSAAKRACYPAMLSASRVNAGLVRRLRLARGAAKFALVTSASRDNAFAVLSHHKLTDLFDVIVTGCDVERHKPAPDAFQLAAGRLGVRPTDCLALEDSDVGKAAAAAFGARCIGISMRAAPQL